MSRSSSSLSTEPRAKDTRAKEPRAWQRMLSGRRLDLLDPSPLDVEIEDIAHGLSRMARWNGQTVGPYVYSVAQHSVLVERLGVHLMPDLSPHDRLVMLLHDAPEYVIGDIISPFKAAVGETYKTIEARLLNAIHIRFGMSTTPSPPLKRLTKKADRLAAHLEAVHLAGFDPHEAEKFFGPLVPLPKTFVDGLEPTTANEAKHRFLAAFKSLNQG
jgi:uncharacterized protein